LSTDITGLEVLGWYRQFCEIVLRFAARHIEPACEPL